MLLKIHKQWLYLCSDMTEGGRPIMGVRIKIFGCDAEEPFSVSWSSWNFWLCNTLFEHLSNFLWVFLEYFYYLFIFYIVLFRLKMAVCGAKSHHHCPWLTEGHNTLFPIYAGTIPVSVRNNGVCVILVSTGQHSSKTCH